MTTCPQCGKEQHFVCSRKACSCHNIPDGEKAQIYVPVFRDQYVGRDIFNVYWGLFVRDDRLGRRFDLFAELLRCPYCGYENTFDFWEDRSITQYLEEQGVTSFAELQEKEEG